MIEILQSIEGLELTRFDEGRFVAVAASESSTSSPDGPKEERGESEGDGSGSVAAEFIGVGVALSTAAMAPAHFGPRAVMNFYARETKLIGFTQYRNN